MDRPQHEQAWTDALAEEHTHQLELLAALRHELGTFAKEAASTLTALETFAGIAGVAEIVSSAATDMKDAALVVEVGKRLGIGAPLDKPLEELYQKLGGGEDAPPSVVRHASELLKQKEPRSDRQLLSAVVSAAGKASGVEEILGPAPWAALAALKPLARRAPQLAKLRRGDRIDTRGVTADLAQVLQATAQLGAGADTALAGEAVALVDSIREAVHHIEAAAKAVEDGSLRHVVAEMRKTLESDLDKLRGIHEGAHEAPPEWREARKAEHAELREEVRTKLERVERIAAILWQILPRLQAVVRSLSVVQKAVAVEHRLEPQAATGAEAAKLTLIATLGAAWDAAFGDAGTTTAPPVRRLRARYLVAAAAVVAAAIAGVVLASSSGKRAVTPVGDTTTPTTPQATSEPTLTPIDAVFLPGPSGVPCRPPNCTTVYTENAGGANLHYTWSVSIPLDPGCAAGFRPNTPTPNQATWYHADVSEGGPCNHSHYDAAGFGHPGWVTVVVTDGSWSCRDRFHGTQGPQAQATATGSAPSRCQPLGVQVGIGGT